MTEFKNNLIDKIKTGEVDMKPKWHFVLRGMLLLTGIVTVVLSAVYLLSFIFFVLHRSGVIFVPGFGLRGVWVFLTSFPWLLVVVVGIFLAVLYVLVKRYAFSYQRPFVYSMLGVALVVVIGSLLVQETMLHDRLEAYTKERPLPGIGKLYREPLESRRENIAAGTIIAITATGFMLETPRGEVVTVEVSKRTRQQPGATYQVGDTVRVFGDRVTATELRAFGIKLHDDSPRTQVRGWEGRVPPPKSRQ